MTEMTQAQLVQLANNPTRGINQVISSIETNYLSDTASINSKSHPAVLAMDLILGSTHGFLNQMTDCLSKNFAPHARNIAELSPHMSPEEKVGIFANPSTVTGRMVIREDIYLSIAQDVTVTIGKSTYTYKMLLIPKDTELTISGYTFAIENGIEIRYGEKTGYQVVYDDSTNNPFNPISANLLTRGFKQSGSYYYLYIDIPMRQLKTKAVENKSSNSATGCNGTIAYTDYLYAVRAFLTVNGVKSEILVTFDQDVFDPATVTLALVLDTTNQSIAYEIPDVYITNGLGIGIVDIYVLTTKGTLTKDFTQTTLSEVSMNWQDYRYGSGTLNSYAAPVKNTSGLQFQLITATVGGSDALDFATIKQNFLLGRRQRALPITEEDVSGTVSALGYQSVKAIDYVTERIYALTKELPIQDNKGFNSPMGVFVGSYLASAANLVASGVVLDNGSRVTIPHNVLFDISDPTTLLVNGITKAQYAAMTNAQLVDLVGNRTLVYTPFYYVLDMTSNQAVLRTYHLDTPVVNQQTFVDENSTLGFELGVGSIAVEGQEDGYLITIVTQSGSTYQGLENEQIGVQLSIASEGSTTLANMAGTLYGVTEDGERIFQFKLQSNFDVDVNDVLYFTNFSQFGSVQPQTGSQLNLDMTFIFTYVGDKAYTATDSDEKIDQTLFAEPMIAIIETRYNVDLGKRLNNLYSRIRPLVGTAQYKQYQSNIPNVYAQDEYERDPDTGFLVYGDDGKAILKHRAGDTVYLSDGSVSLKYVAGDYEKDAQGNYVVLEPRDLEFHWDFIAFDAIYFFSQDPYDIDFAAQTKAFFATVITGDLVSLGQRSINMTNLIFQPRSKMGYKKVVVNSNYESTIKQDISFVVTYYLTATGYRNTNLKKSLKSNTATVLNTVLFDAVTFSTSDLVKALSANVSSDVVSVTVSAIAGDNTVDVVSNADSLTGFSIAKLLQEASDGTLTGIEDVDVVFQPHDTSMLTLIST